GVRRGVFAVHLRRRLYAAQSANQVLKGHSDMNNRTMTDTAGRVAPKPPSRLARFTRNVGLLRESPVGMFGAALILFWVAMAALAPILPLYDPLEPLAPFQT